METGTRDTTSADVMGFAIRKVAHITFAAIFGVAFLVVYTGLTAAFDTEQIPTVFGFLAGQARPHGAGPYRPTLASIAESIAAFAVLGAWDVGNILGPSLGGTGIGDDSLKGSEFEPPPCGGPGRICAPIDGWHWKRRVRPPAFPGGWIGRAGMYTFQRRINRRGAGGRFGIFVGRGVNPAPKGCFVAGRTAEEAGGQKKPGNCTGG